MVQTWSQTHGMDSHCGRFLIAIFCGAEHKSPKSRREKTIRVGISKEGFLEQVKHKLDRSKITSRTGWQLERNRKEDISDTVKRWSDEDARKRQATSLHGWDPALLCMIGEDV